MIGRLDEARDRRERRHELAALEVADLIGDTEPAALRRALTALDSDELGRLRQALLQRR